MTSSTESFTPISDTPTTTDHDVPAQGEIAGQEGVNAPDDLDPQDAANVPDEATSPLGADGEPPVPPGRWRRTRQRFPKSTSKGAFAALIVVLLAGTGAAVAAAMHKTVILDVQGESREVSTFAGSVEALLAEEGIEVGEHDLVVPGLDEALREQSEVVVRYAQQIEVEIDGEQEQVWSTALHVGEALSDLQAMGRDVSMVVTRSADRASVDMPLVRNGRAIVLADGEEHQVVAEGEASLDGVIALAGLELAELDTVEVDVREGGVPVVTIARVVVSERVETESIAHGSREENTTRYYEGTTRVGTEGVDGVKELRYEVTTIDGEEVSAELTSETITQEPIEEVILIGTAVRPVVTPTASSSSSSASSSSSSTSSSGGSSGGGSVSGDVWAALAQCESGGNPSIVSSNGLYHGLYQFSVATWQSVGGTGLPSQASASEQTQRAQALQARSGWGQWPSCSRQLGLR